MEFINLINQHSYMENEDFCTYEQSVKLNELGFDWECHKKYGIKPMCFGKFNLLKGTEWTDYPEGYLYDKDHVGYNEKDFILAPTLYQAQKWIREIKHINVDVIACFSRSLDMWQWDCFIHSLEDDEIDESTISHDTYEQALMAGIDKALELIK